MKLALAIVVSCSLALPLPGLTQSTVQTAGPALALTAHDVHRLMKSAHSAAEYKTLADYFRSQEAMYRAKAADEKVERDRRAQVNAGLYQKYPRPVDSAQYLYESYVSEADKAALHAKRYGQLAADQSFHDHPLATTSKGEL